MSSRIYAGGETDPAEPLVWRKVEGEAGGARTGLAGPGHDTQSRILALEREIESRACQERELGRQEGLAAGQEEAARARERVAQTVAELAEYRPLLRRQAEADLVRLALAIARRILHRELAVDPDAMRGLIGAALDKLQAQEICRVRTHPADEPLLRRMLEGRAQANQVEILADPALARGAAVFETARGNLDASVETQLREIEQGLADRLRRPA